MSAASEYPRLVAIETTNYCNARCVFCPNDRLTRGRMHMSDELFEEILDQCRRFPLEAIEPFLQGEPFSDPKIVERLERIRSRLPRARLRLYTNGFGLTPQRVDQLLGLGIDHLYVSLNTLNPEKYERDIGLRLERTLENLRYLADPKRRGRVARSLTFRMTRLPSTTLAEQDSFIDYCKRHGARPSVVGTFNYKGDIPSNLPVPGYPCEHVDRFDILCNGVVTLCCQDHDGAYSWGDVTRRPLLEVFNGEVARRYRTAHRTGHRRDVEPCGRCNLFWFSLNGLPVWQRARVAVEAAAYFVRYRPIGRRAPTVDAATPLG